MNQKIKISFDYEDKGKKYKQCDYFTVEEITDCNLNQFIVHRFIDFIQLFKNEKPKRISKKAPYQRYTDEQVKEIRRLYKAGSTTRQISESMNIPFTYCQTICRGKTRKNVK